MWFCGLHLLPYLVSTFKRVAAGLGGIIELCQDINYNQKQLFCAPETLSAPSYFPLPSVAPSRPFLILCKLYYFHCLFTSLPILYPSAQDLRRLSGFCRVSPFLSLGTVLKSFPGTPFPPKISLSALYRFKVTSWSTFYDIHHTIFNYNTL